jgi:hypothetical protein
MTILKNCPLFYCKVDPKRPNSKFNRENPTWEVQIRTTNKDQKKEWEQANLLVKPVVPDDGPPYWRVNLRKKSIRSNGEASTPVELIDGKLQPVDPNTVGNGSVGNVKVYQYEYEKKQGGGKGIVSVLMGIQLVKHVLYTPKPRDDDFGDAGETEIVAEEMADSAEDDEKFE